MNTRLYVGNLSFHTTADGVRTAFQEFGTVSDVHLVSDRETGRSRGFAFVTMGTPEEAAKAIEGMDGRTPWVPGWVRTPRCCTSATATWLPRLTPSRSSRTKSAGTRYISTPTIWRVRGALPAWFLMTLLLPEHHADEAVLSAIFREVQEACAAIGAHLVGGHTEVTVGLDRPILAGAMLGEVRTDRLVTTSGARVGDAIVLSKGVAIEGTSVLARAFADRLRDRGILEATLAAARDFVRRPGLSVLPEAQAALAQPGGTCLAIIEYVPSIYQDREM